MGLKSINNGNNNHLWEEQQAQQLNSLQHQLNEALMQLTEKDSIIDYQQNQYEKLILTVRQQEKLLTERSEQIKLLNNENEKLLKLAESQRQLQDRNSRLEQEIQTLQTNLTSEKMQSETLQKNITAVTDNYNNIVKNLPTLTEITTVKNTLCQLIDTAKKINDVAEDTRITNYVSWGVVAVFVLMCGAVGWMSYGAKTQATKAHTAIIQGIYDNDGWSILSGSQSDIVHKEYIKQHPTN